MVQPQGHLKPGYKVLVLLTSLTKKLLAQCVNYEVVMGVTRKRKVVFHANMLKKWREKDHGALHVEEVKGEEDELEIPDWKGPIPKKFSWAQVSNESGNWKGW